MKPTKAKKEKIDMKKMITIGAMVLFFILAASSAHALVWFGPTDHIITLDGRFNYTFLVNMSFSQAGNGDDWIMLNYENITIIPHGTGTGTGTINSWTDTMRDITVCTNDTEVNMSFVNLTASTDLLIVEDGKRYANVTDNTNYTFSPTASCKRVQLYDISTSYGEGSRSVIIFDNACINKTVMASYSYSSATYLSGGLSRIIIQYIVPIGLLAVLAMAAAFYLKE